jgi:23S rRNA (uracil-5-)-methyltransferase RumA
MKFGDKTTLRVTEMDKKGRGCGLAGERRACAYFSAPGEEIEAALISRKQGVLIMRTETVKTPSPHRRQAPCPHAGQCGGCKWQQFDYGFQLSMKKEMLMRTLAAAGLADKISGVVPSPDEYHYRNRMDYCVGPKGEIGLKEPGRWNAYIDLQTCLLLSPEAARTLDIFRGYMRRNGVAPWDNQRYTGYARYLVIREGKNTGERMIIVVTAAGPLPAKDELVKELSDVATTIYHGINPLVTDISIASELELLRGPAFLQEKVAGRTFRIPPNSFFQTNTAMAERLVETVRHMLSPRPPRLLLDLYCGVGLFGICLADTAGKVIGLEIDEPAIVAARTNAEINGVTNAEFTAAKAESLVWEKDGPDTVIVDPPRAGLHPSVVDALLRLAPERIVYVSCNYESFVRDWQKLGAAYDAIRLEALDLFPHTPHLELVSLLQKKNHP